MPEFFDADLRGSRFERVDLSGAQFRTVDLSDAQFRAVYLKGAVMRGVELVDVDIHGEVVNLTINGVDIEPLVDAELNRGIPSGPRCDRQIPPATGRLGMSSNGSGTALAASRRPGNREFRKRPHLGR